jgi:hypothetical protein
MPPPWKIEELHRGIKQLTGSEKCAKRVGRVVLNAITWLVAIMLGARSKSKLSSAELAYPCVPAFSPV